MGAVAALVGAAVAVQVGILSSAGPAARAGGPAKPAQQQVGEAYGHLPLSFVENQGQSDGQVRYLASGPRYGFYFTSTSLVMSMLGPDGDRGVNLALNFVGGNADASVGAAEQTPATVNYLRGDASAGSQVGLPTFGQVVYRQLWPGVTMAINGRDGVLKYEFRVAPGARVDDIKLAYRGTDGDLATDSSGDLLIDTAIGALHDSAPVSYQVVGGRRVPVNSGYRLTGAGSAQSYGFSVGRYDPTRELVIDPGVEYSTLLGGAGNQNGAAIAVDASGDAYVTGFTQSSTFPTTPGAFDRTGSANDDLDAFVSKLNPTGTGLVYSTFLGGSNFEWGRDIALDAAGDVYVAGQTKSSNFPTTSGAFDRTFNVANCPRCGVDQYDAFVTKLNPSGSKLVYSTFLGGTDIDDILALAVDGSGQAYVAGQTVSHDFPTTSGAFDTTNDGGYDAFVTKLNAQGSRLAYSTLLGGNDNELPGGIAVDAAGDVVVGGSTRSLDYPTTAGALQRTHSGGDSQNLFEGFITKLNPAGSALVYSTFLGGTKQESVGHIALDPQGDVYLGGSTMSPEFPTTPGAFDTTFNGPFESFVAKLNPSGSALLYSTFLGGAGADVGAVNPDGSVWLAGSTSSPDSFVTADAWDSQFNGGTTDAYVAELDPAGSALTYATFLGGADSDGATDLALGPNGDVYLTGSTRSADFPTTAGAFDRVFSADPNLLGADAWIAKLAVGPDAPTPPVQLPAPAAPTIVGPANATTVALPVTLRWAPGTGGRADAASYTIQIDDTPSFGTPLTLSADVTGTEFTTGDLPAGMSFWRVRALSADGTPSLWSQVRSVIVPSAPPPPAAPAPGTASLLSPAAGGRVSQPFTFDWSDVTGAAWYRIDVSDDPNFGSLVWAATTTPSQLATNSLPNDSNLFWRVRAFNSDGVGGDYSAVRTVSVN
ncbi:hypothetical protein GCM10023322_30340 [Rugosimonospora acidiphila]|uniref:Fibronectin type-III domain-containing protein n=1 Tax=Rugosimonospora acidiphila TaxID=556531 RepID=A0ABP9RT59_9ACTN